MRVLWLTCILGAELSVFDLPLPAEPPHPGTLEIPVLLDGSAVYRNERSTPRDSILPFSPAIAPHEPIDRLPAATPLAKAILRRLGYNVGRLDGRATARFKAAVFQFQRARGLTASGELDLATLRTLGLASR